MKRMEEDAGGKQSRGEAKAREDGECAYERVHPSLFALFKNVTRNFQNMSITIIFPWIKTA